MNHTEHTMPRAGRTTDRMTTDPGWAAWKYEGRRLEPADKALLFIAAVTAVVCGLIGFGYL